MHRQITTFQTQGTVFRFKVNVNYMKNKCHIKVDEVTSKQPFFELYRWRINHV